MLWTGFARLFQHIPTVRQARRGCFFIFTLFLSYIYYSKNKRFLFPSPLQDQGMLQKVWISNTIAELCYSWLNWILKSPRLSLKWQQQISPNLVLHWLSHAFIATFHNKLAHSCTSGAMALSKSVICSSPNDWYVGVFLIVCFLLSLLPLEK